ncbi:MAG: hypothetical protein LIO59_07295, partial [Oscillospiraceae bacterium]|nr:hypothetical protein [Oscillospiraceae bacterium]
SGISSCGSSGLSITTPSRRVSTASSSEFTPSAKTSTTKTPTFRATDTSNVPQTVTYNGATYRLTAKLKTRFARLLEPSTPTEVKVKLKEDILRNGKRVFTA